MDGTGKGAESYILICKESQQERERERESERGERQRKRRERVRREKERERGERKSIGEQKQIQQLPSVYRGCPPVLPSFLFVAARMDVHVAQELPLGLGIILTSPLHYLSSSENNATMGRSSGKIYCHPAYMAYLWLRGTVKSPISSGKHGIVTRNGQWGSQDAECCMVI